LIAEEARMRVVPVLLSREISHNFLFVPNHQQKLTKMSNPVKIVVSVLAMAALVATLSSFNKVSEMSNRT
jgi:hypothetical protein